MRKYTSDKIANLSWICSILVVLIHATTYAFNLPGAQTGTIYGKNVSTFVQMFLAEGVCRIAVPLFFIFSGYLFFRDFELTVSCIASKLRRRIFSLVIPYLFWSAATFLFFYIAQSIPATASYFSSRPVVGIGIKKTLSYILMDSLNSPLWYLRNLIILTVLTPLLYVLLKKLWFLALPAACVCGVLDVGALTLRGVAICAFSVGGFLAIQKEMVCTVTSKLKGYKTGLTVALGVCWLLILAVKASYLCNLDASILISGQYTEMLKMLNGVNIAVGIPAAWLIYDAVASHCEIGRLTLGRYGMMVFVMHHPVIAVVKKVLLMIIGSSMWSSLICYFASAAITVALVMVVSMVLCRYAKGLYRLVSGGR